LGVSERVTTQYIKNKVKPRQYYEYRGFLFYKEILDQDENGDHFEKLVEKK
jgi:hypothetical protein